MPSGRVPGPAGRISARGVVSGQLVVSSGPLGTKGQGSVSYEEFKQQVLQGQIRWAIGRGRKFIDTLPDSELGEVENGFRLRPAACRACRALLSDARDAWTADKATGDGHAQQVSMLGIHSAYRSNAEENEIWNRNYPNYYRATQQSREGARGGPHGARALAILIAYVCGRKAAPGYSNHSDGTAVDFRTDETGHRYLPDTSPENRSAWRNTWFHAWLVANAPDYGFHPLTTEEWHWDYR